MHEKCLIHMWLLYQLHYMGKMKFFRNGCSGDSGNKLVYLCNLGDSKKLSWWQVANYPSLAIALLRYYFAVA